MKSSPRQGQAGGCERDRKGSPLGGTGGERRTLKNHWNQRALILASLLAFPSIVVSSPAASKRARALYDRAAKEREQLAATPESERTRAGYEKVILDFRTVYRLDPTLGRTPLALRNVAELYREMGRRFADSGYFQTSIGAYEFMMDHYPASPLAADALLTIGDVYFADLHNTARARKAYETFLKKHPRSEKAVYARDQLKMVEATAASDAQMRGLKESAETSSPVPTPGARLTTEETRPGQPARVISVRRWVGPNYTRIVINIDGEVQFDARRLVSPDRLVFDLANARPDVSLVGNPLSVEDGFLKQVRVALYRPNVTRVVLDVERIQDFSVFSLPNPFRLVIDVHGPPREAPRTERAAGAPATPAATKGTKPQTGKLAATAKTLQTAPLTIRPEPVRPSTPTESGSRTLTRALGLKIGRIVIDPGHGGHDTGTLGPTGVMEKDVVLDVALRLARLIERETGNEVILTRKDDTFIPLEERTAIANQKGADLFISIHANASSDNSARGLETYYLNFTSDPGALEVAARENATSQESVHELQDLVKKIVLTEKIQESHDFASKVETEMHAGLARNGVRVRDRGVKKAPFVVLIGANMPSVLSEISFLTNPSDERLLKKAEYRQKIAEALLRGIFLYANNLGGVKVAEQSRTQGKAAPLDPVSPSPDRLTGAIPRDF
ncbi:MAG: hypothetical protein DMG22_04180 [Acidobacteria bacterium]|nr:MAG: hypothetical protein DMG22_04180 [Acidobacteriota bacterium]